MEDLNIWVTTIASYITLIKFLSKALLEWLPKIRKSLKKRRKHNRKR